MAKSLAHQVSMALVAVMAAGTLVGCRGDQTDKPPRQFFPDMDDQPKYKAQSRSNFFKDYKEPAHPETLVREDYRAGKEFGRTMRDPMKGTVAFGYAPHAMISGAGVVNTTFMGVDFAGRDAMLATDEAVYEGTNGFATGPDGKTLLDATNNPVPKYIDSIPIPVDEELLAIGQEQYNIYCIVCHGGTGDGKGMVGLKWSYPLPTYHDPKYYRSNPATGLPGEKGQDGYIFHVIRNGVPNVGGTYEYKMRPYATKLSVKESWAVVAYIRALQQSELGTLQDVPDAERERLNRMRGQAPALAPAPAATPAPTATPAVTPPAPSTTTPATQGGEL